MDRDGPRTLLAADVAAGVPNAPKSTLANERFIALLIRIDSKKPEAPSSAPAMISTLLPMREAGRRGGEAGVRVEQRDHDRHVGAADRQHHRDADAAAPSPTIT